MKLLNNLLNKFYFLSRLLSKNIADFYFKNSIDSINNDKSIVKRTAASFSSLILCCMVFCSSVSKAELYEDLKGSHTLIGLTFAGTSNPKYGFKTKDMGYSDLEKYTERNNPFYGALSLNIVKVYRNIFSLSNCFEIGLMKNRMILALEGDKIEIKHKNFFGSFLISAGLSVVDKMEMYLSTGLNLCRFSNKAWLNGKEYEFSGKNLLLPHLVFRSGIRLMVHKRVTMDLFYIFSTSLEKEIRVRTIANEDIPAFKSNDDFNKKNFKLKSKFGMIGITANYKI
ncbi:hypothetical protein [Candidatus Nesciobacter abundans]|uniref:Uncharacterized protein n=1 Tax=Candidatus Nesciobacter abundans TaxID=2601668 RepID=A0A5C0UGJ9_9PROT|nr:hypothetical protein [Candidatus Nesciobacter abundans]QEK38837.1 hypothetical protein FZC36_00035 [Candidatus Nesciobacter abundans]